MIGFIGSYFWWVFMVKRCFEIIKGGNCKQCHELLNNNLNNNIVKAKNPKEDLFIMLLCAK